MSLNYSSSVMKLITVVWQHSSSSCWFKDWVMNVTKLELLCINSFTLSSTVISPQYITSILQGTVTDGAAIFKL
jgi:hypothetical protein